MVTIGTNWGNNCVKGTVYNFTLTKPVPVGGQFAETEKQKILIEYIAMMTDVELPESEEGGEEYAE